MSDILFFLSIAFKGSLQRGCPFAFCEGLPFLYSNSKCKFSDSIFSNNGIPDKMNQLFTMFPKYIRQLLVFLSVVERSTMAIKGILVLRYVGERYLSNSNFF